jgi:photosystem II stability/assembly factor-like uncharacterized protein
MTRVVRIVLISALTLCSLPLTAQEWLQAIPQRAIFSITSNPQNPSSLLAGCYSRTGLLSTDAGATWLELSIGEMGGISQISALVYNPGDTNVLLAGGVNFNGVDRSTDGGVTWQNVLSDPDGNRFEVYSNGSFAFNPRNPDTVYTLRTYPAIIYRSTNKGGRWDSIGAIPNLSSSARMKSLAICPQKDSAHIMLAGGRPSTIYRSTNGGRTWASSGAAIAVHPDCDAVQIRWSPTVPGRVYAIGQFAISANVGNAGLMISDDYGLTWPTRKFRDTALQSIEVFPTKSGDEIFIGGGQGALSDKVIKGDSIVWRSPDGGATWQNLSKVDWTENELGEVAANVWGFAVTSVGGGSNEVIMATEVGAYRSTAVTSIRSTSAPSTASIRATPTSILIKTDDGQPSSYSVVNLLGEPVASGPLTGMSEERISTADFPAGTYVVRVTQRDGVSTALIQR